MESQPQHPEFRNNPENYTHELAIGTLSTESVICSAEIKFTSQARDKFPPSTGAGELLPVLAFDQ